MRKAFFISILTAFIFADSFGCINGETKVLKDGTEITLDHEGGIIPQGHIFMESDYSQILKKLDRLWKTTNDIDYLSDYGVVLILQKEYKKAKSIYLEIEKIKPNRYSTASNLGTVYELLGENENAIKWIQKSIQIDPKAHKSSEWLHVKILEAKIKGEAYFTSDFLLNTNFGRENLPTSNLTNKELLRLRDALYFQLNERVSFVEPKDKIIAELLFELANIATLTGAKEEALSIYQQAKGYGFTEPILNLRYENAKSVSQNLKGQAYSFFKFGAKNYLIWVFTILTLGTGLLLLKRWWTRRKNDRQHGFVASGGGRK